MSFENQKISIVIPVFNELDTLGDILKKLENLKLGVKKEIIVIDDYSQDGTRDFLKDLESNKSVFDQKGNEIKVFFQEENFGKGRALKKGFKKSTGDFIVIQDADEEYDSEDFKKMLPLLQKDNDTKVVYGSRFLKKSGKKGYFSNYLANKFLTYLFNILFLSNITDMSTCYKMFKKEVLQGLNIKEDGFEFEPEFTAKLVKNGYNIKEVPISYSPRSYEEGKKISWINGVKYIYCIFKYRFFD